jgi:iron complex outermembrane receptor protein
VPGLLDGAVFYNKFTNQQIDVGLSCAPGNLGGCTPGQGVVNAGKSTLWGVELQGQIRPVESFRLDFNGTYLATKIDRITVPAAPPPFASALPSAAEGGPLPFASKWKATATGTYTLPLPDTVGKVEFGLSYIFDSGYQVIDPAVSPYYKTPKLNLVNLNLNWSHIAGSPVDVSLFATNLFDRTYWTQILNTYNDPFIGGWEGRVLGQPRMFGARIKYRFGR